MLQRVGAGRLGDALDQRHLPIGSAGPPDNAAERAPFRQIARRRGEPETPGRQAAFVEMKAVARRPPGQPGGERGRPALEIAARAEDAVRVDDDASVAHREVLAAHRRHDRLIVDAGVGHQHAERLERGDRARFEGAHVFALAEPLIDMHVETARIGQGRDADPSFAFGRARKAFEKADAGFAEQLGIGHDVRLRHRYEIGRVEEFADRDLMRDGPASRFAELAGQHGPLFVGKAHRSGLPLYFADRTVQVRRRVCKHPAPPIRGSRASCAAGASAAGHRRV